MKQVTKEYLQSLLLSRANDTHKRNYGHLLLVCGSESMPGSALLATGASLKSGCGLVTLHSVKTATSAAMIAYPSAMLSVENEPVLTTVPENLEKYSCIGIGPGLGRDFRSAMAFMAILERAYMNNTPMLLDADALFFLSQDKSLWKLIPKGSVMTPHDGELARFIKWDTPKQKYEYTLSLAMIMGCVIVSKGYHSQIFTPEGEVFENTTGNPGMAKGGSGDVLTGLVSGLMARGYKAVDAALLGTWIHGFAGDSLTRRYTAEAYSSKDLIDALWEGFKELEA